ncbi:hypothetical protein CROQUDRAFT_454394 [Cronartium quercuum f. sp. fusiforme G11]|uniref:Uncharacterized protein n=1 Tax=Cronartium quercuum f. sp. fusiforme G11 TaxID=708437 RepID=A0A9P6TCT0_9BASI|nr:hypothetical protein CROQUDRAFT_454394 [Cronartium quercuum f. sp. fusiforme G11]
MSWHHVYHTQLGNYRKSLITIFVVFTELGYSFFLLHIFIVCFMVIIVVVTFGVMVFDFVLYHW